MKKILVFQHVAHEILGTLHPLLKKAGFRIRYINFGRTPDAKTQASGYDGLIILGGPMGVYQVNEYPHLAEEIFRIKDFIQQDKPVLGICLGAQLTAAALGAEVRPNPEKEIGWYDVSLTEDGKKDPILGQMAETERIFQWHGDTFEIPDHAVWLAQSALCRNQAFRYGDKVYGFQFHLEVDEPMVKRWLEIPTNLREIETTSGKIQPDAIRTETHRRIAHLMALSHRVFQRYITLFSTKRRRLTLGSRH